MSEPQPRYTSPAGRDGAAARILVVDDAPAVRRYVRRILEAEGYAVHEAADGAEALELVRSEPAAWDLIVSDIVMPRCNGVELHERLAAHAFGMPVILMSGYATTELTRLGIAAPCAVLVKPFEADRLLDEVRRCLPVQS
jgi:DNA-binding NtrC family response regulator